MGVSQLEVKLLGCIKCWFFGAQKVLPSCCQTFSSNGNKWKSTLAATTMMIWRQTGRGQILKKPIKLGVLWWFTGIPNLIQTNEVNKNAYNTIDFCEILLSRSHVSENTNNRSFRIGASFWSWPLKCVWKLTRSLNVVFWGWMCVMTNNFYWQILWLIVYL